MQHTLLELSHDPAGTHTRYSGRAMEGIMPLERFEGPVRLQPSGLSVTLQPSSKVTLSEQAAGDVARPAGRAIPEAVELYFDREERVVGIRAVPRGTPHSFAARKQRHGATVVFTALSFFTHYAIDLGGVSRRFPASMKGDILCLNLNGESEVITGPRTMQRAARAPAANEGDQAGGRAGDDQSDKPARAAVG